MMRLGELEVNIDIKRDKGKSPQILMDKDK